MPFLKAAGTVPVRAFVPSSTRSGLPEGYSVPLTGTAPSYGCQTSCISNAIRDTAIERNRLELEQIARRRDAESEFRIMLTSLKDRIASKAAAYTQGPGALAEAYCRAS